MFSRIYAGRVRHRRFQPRYREFSYSLFMVYIDLDELEQLARKHWLFSLEKWNLMTFRRRDHLGRSEVTLRQSVTDFIHNECGEQFEGRIRLLTHLAYFGYRFNPVSFYYCFDEQEKLRYIISEVNNTPWGEQHCYLHKITDSSARMHNFLFGKQFHVSPFIPMDIDYDWRFGTPGKSLNVHMLDSKNSETVFDATLQLKRKPMTSGSLLLSLVQFPLMTLKVVAAIYFQALILWLKRTPFYTHPAKKEAPDVAKES